MLSWESGVGPTPQFRTCWGGPRSPLPPEASCRIWGKVAQNRTAQGTGARRGREGAPQSDCWAGCAADASHLTEEEPEARGVRAGSGVAAAEAPPPTCLRLSSWLAACGWSRAPSGSASSHWGGWGGAGTTPPGAGRGWGLQGRGPGGGDRQGRGPLPGPRWVGRRPPGSGCEARPSVTATINMFVQGKPGWELCAPAWGGRKGRLCLAHWGDCSRSRNCCPVAGKVRRPSGPVGSNWCLRPLCSLPAVTPVHPHHLWALAWEGRCQARRPRQSRGKRRRESARLAGAAVLSWAESGPRNLGGRGREAALGTRAFTVGAPGSLVGRSRAGPGLGIRGPGVRAAERPGP